MLKPAASAVLAAAGPRSYVPVLAFSAMAWAATLVSQGLAPALPGSATGIAWLIRWTAFAAACVSQLVAAGGVALCLRLLSRQLSLASAGIAARVVLALTTLSVVALVIASAARPLEPELGRLLSVAAIVAITASVPGLLTQPPTRLIGGVFLAAALSSGVALVSLELGRRGVLSGQRGLLSPSLDVLGVVLDIGACALVVHWISRTRRSLSIHLGSVVGLCVFAAWLVQTPATGVSWPPAIVLRRSLEALSRFSPWSPPVAAALECVPLGLGAVLLFSGARPGELRASLILCLLATTSVGAPVPALLGVGGVLIATRALAREHSGTG